LSRQLATAAKKWFKKPAEVVKTSGGLACLETGDKNWY